MSANTSFLFEQNCFKISTIYQRQNYQNRSISKRYTLISSIIIVIIMRKNFFLQFRCETSVFSEFCFFKFVKSLCTHAVFSWCFLLPNFRHEPTFKRCYSLALKHGLLCKWVLTINTCELLLNSYILVNITSLLKVPNVTLTRINPKSGKRVASSTHIPLSLTNAVGLSVTACVVNCNEMHLSGKL